jgi:thiamine biosynthesis lipoprotein
MLKPQVDSILERIDLSLSKYRKDAILYKVNENQDVELDDHFIKNFNKAMEISKATNGMFDITVGPLVDLFGFGDKKRGDITDTALVDSLLQFVGYNKVKIVNRHLVKQNPGIQLDFNAIAQGYSVDVIADYFERIGIKNYMIEVGGETMCRGHNEFGDEWRIGVEKPIENTDATDRVVELILGFKNVKKAVATSGDYRKFYIANGIKYTHTIDPHTGFPVKDSLVSASIMADDCMTADGYATACMASGFKKAKELVNAHPELEAFFIYFDHNGKYKFYITPGFKKYVIE